MELISFELVGKVLEQDIVSDKEVLLLKKGTILTHSNIELLKKHKYKKVKVSEVTFEDLYLRNVNNIQELFTSLHKIYKIPLKQWFKQDEVIVSFIQNDASVLDEIYTKNKIKNIYFHSANVGLIAFFLGKLLRYSYEDKLMLWQMGVLHDIGKMKLSPELVENRESLTDEQVAEYEKYPERSWNILKEAPDIDVKIMNVARSHQERLDGSGYPRGLTVKYLHLMVQIISVADLIDELLSRGENNIFDVIYELNDETLQNKLNPAIVKPFICHTLRKYIGKRVRLNDESEAEIAFVFDHEPSQPLLHDREAETFIDLRKFQNLKIVAFA